MTRSFSLLPLLLLACGSNDGGGGSVKNEVRTQLTSSNLQTAAQKGVSFGGAGCFVPDNIVGGVYNAGLIMFFPSQGTGYQVGPIIGTDNRPDLIVDFSYTELQDFDFLSPELNAGTIELGTPLGMMGEGMGPQPYPTDDVELDEISFFFGYVSLQFRFGQAEAENPNMEGTHELTIVYGDVRFADGSETWQQGDILYRSDLTSNQRMWCDSDTCDHSSRPTSPLQYQEVVDFDGTPDGKGNQEIPAFAVNLTNDPKIAFPQSVALDPNLQVSVDLDTRCIMSFAQLTNTYADPAAMAADFVLTRSFSGESGDGITAELSLRTEAR